MAKTKKGIVCELRCWQGRKILLHKSTLIHHVGRLHLDSLFVVDALKRNFSMPICVKKNERNGSLNAYYDIETGGQPFLLVAVQIVSGMARFAGQCHFIKTFYGVDSLPPGPYEWERRS